MKFGIRECANIVFRAKQETQIGSTTFHVGQPVLYIDTATTSSIEQATTSVYAQGGRGNPRLIAWEGDKTLTFTVEDALLSPIGFAILSGAGLFRKTADSTDKVHYHMTTMTTVKADGTIDLTEALAEFGVDEAAKTGKAEICLQDAPLYVMGIEDDGSLNGKIYMSTDSTGAVANGTASINNDQYTFKSVISGFTEAKNRNVMVDYYVDLPGKQVYEADLTADMFAGFYYVEADTLFRRQSDGKDMPANLTFPNVKIQSNFTITMAGTGDPSTFTFTMDAFPGYTYFDKTKKVLCVLQIVEDATKSASRGEPVMPHTEGHEHDEESVYNDIFDGASNAGMFKDEADEAGKTGQLIFNRVILWGGSITTSPFFWYARPPGYIFIQCRRTFL